MIEAASSGVLVDKIQVLLAYHSSHQGKLSRVRRLITHGEMK